MKVIGGLRSDTVLYDLKPKPTGKRGRPRKKGDRLNYRDFDFQKENNFFIATRKGMTNLYDKPVFITVTTTDINKFTSVRMYLSTVEIDDINTKYNRNPKQESLNLYEIYNVRWNIEVMFYQQKNFWSFGEYMIRNKIAIEKYFNLIGVAYSAVILISFINKNFEKLQFCSPQEIKYTFGETIKNELIFSKLLKIDEIKENLPHLRYLRPFKDLDNLAS